MISKIFSCSFLGLDCKTVEVQADISPGLPNFTIVGLGDASVQEAKERVRSGIKNSGLDFPVTRKTINLAPAQIKKQGSMFDLPIAISLLAASGQLDGKFFSDAVLIGELTLGGEVKAVKGVLPVTLHAKHNGFKKIFLPEANSAEAKFIEGITIYPLKNLKQLVEFSFGRDSIQPQKSIGITEDFLENSRAKENLISKIIGLEFEKRALAIAAAGHHNVLLYGSPGSGKTVLARAFRDLLSPMTAREIYQTTELFSITGLLPPERPLILQRPFREVHHTTTAVSLIGGGGPYPRPGEISLAHNGVLFLDEIAEFPRHILEALRQPLEDGFININRANFSLKFPSRFILIATMNPCPCGFRNDKKTSCRCSDSQIRLYHKKLSGPLLDRFDIFLNVEKVASKKFLTQAEVANFPYNQEISTAVQLQKKRFCNHPAILHNSDMTISEIKKHCALPQQLQDFLNRAAENLDLSSRGYLRTLKIARTIADLENSPDIEQKHLAEALQYRHNLNASSQH